MSQADVGERTWIDECADRFEGDWKRGDDRPRIEDYCAGTKGGQALSLTALVLSG